jgi:hypothetical protein
LQEREAAAAAWNLGTGGGALNRGGPGCLGVRAQGGGGGDGTGMSRTRDRVWCGAGKVKPDRRAPPVSVRGREGGRRGQPGPGWGNGPHARGKKRKEREGRGRLGRGGKKGERRGRWAGWAGPKEEKRDGERGKIKQLLLNLKMKFEFKRKTTKIPMQRA